MIIRYFSHQDKFDALNGKPIEQPAKLAEMLHRRRNQRPFVAEVSGDDGFQIVFGISTDLCCAEYRRIDGAPPYLMAVSPNRSVKRGYFEFFAGNTPTPIAARYIISFEELKQIALSFCRPEREVTRSLGRSSIEKPVKRTRSGHTTRETAHGWLAPRTRVFGYLSVTFRRCTARHGFS